MNSLFMIRKVGSFAQIKGGKRLPAGHQFIDGESAYPYIRAQDIRGGYIQKTAAFISRDTYDALARYRVQTGDVCLTIAGNVGDVAYIDETLSGTSLTENAARLTNLEGVLPKYVTYALLHQEVQASIKAMAGGAAQPKLGLYKVKELEIPVPPWKIQANIIEVLASYDDLIAANQRRIQLLEESARLLYREWFVKLRFPGHETVPVSDGVPEGWSKLPLGDLAHVVMGQSPESKYFNEDGQGLPFHQGVTDFGDRFVTHSIFSTHSTRIALPGDILCSVRAPVGRLNVTLDKIVIGRGLSAMRSKMNTQSLLFYQLKHLFFKEDLIGGGAIFASVGKKELFSQELLHPSEQVASAFDKFTSGIDQQIEALTLQNRRLQEARDLLLPKLMSGALDVSRIKLPTEVAA